MVGRKVTVSNREVPAQISDPITDICSVRIPVQNTLQIDKYNKFR